jgi:hypothetical protein
VQHREGVARAVSGREDDLLGLDRRAFGCGRARDRDGADVPVLDQQVGHALAESDLAAERLDLGAHLLDHADQPERSDVRLADVEDLVRRAGLDELVEHLAAEVARVTDLAPQLAVREGAGAAFAELHVRLRIEDALPPEPPGVAGPLAHRLAAFEDDRAQPHLREQQSAEDAARAEADDDRPVCAVNREVCR